MCHYHFILHLTSFVIILSITDLMLSYFSSNQLSGTIPDSIGNLADIQDLYVSVFSHQYIFILPGRPNTISPFSFLTIEIGCLTITSLLVVFQTQFVSSLGHASNCNGMIFLVHIPGVVRAVFFLVALKTYQHCWSFMLTIGVLLLCQNCMVWADGVIVLLPRVSRKSESNRKEHAVFSIRKNIVDIILSDAEFSSIHWQLDEILSLERKFRTLFFYRDFPAKGLTNSWF